MATACVYAVCRCNGHSRMLNEVVAVERVERSRVWNDYRVLQRELELAAPPRLPVAFVPKLASAVEVPARTRRLARDLAERVQTVGLISGSNPAGFGAGCLAAAAAERGELVLNVISRLWPTCVRRRCGRTGTVFATNRRCWNEAILSPGAAVGGEYAGPPQVSLLRETVDADRQECPIYGRSAIVRYEVS